MRKVLITGINGQDGTILSNILSKKKFAVFGITNKKLKKKINNVKLVSTYNLNINKLIKKFEEIKPDIIVHFGSKNPSYYNNFTKKDYKYNLKFTKTIIDYVAQKKIKFIFPSSSSIFKYSKKKLNENSKS
jgi:nucleoside-diphosphate-sugar epimerase